LGIFDRFWVDQDEHEAKVVASAMAESQEIVNWTQMPYHATFMEYLRTEIDKPLLVGNHMDMIQSAARANTLKEIRDYLLRVVRTAQDALATSKQER
jgi:hypothetical protein